jgi:phosphopantetheinyl transferase (holo-ACP synthase)
MSPAEQRFYRNDICLGFAKIWAYKEAVIKASSGRLLFRDIEIEHDSNGAPRVSVADGRSAFMSHCGPPALSQVTWHLTLSDELPYIFAVCIAECNSD